MKARSTLVGVLLMMAAVALLQVWRATSVAHAQTENVFMNINNRSHTITVEVEVPVATTQPLPVGNATVRLDFAYDGGGNGKGGTATLFVNGAKVAGGLIDHTQCCVFSADEGADVGADHGTPVATAYAAPFEFTGRIAKVTVALEQVGGQ